MKVWTRGESEGRRAGFIARIGLMVTGLEGVVPILDETWRDMRAVVVANDVLIGPGKSSGKFSGRPKRTAWASRCTCNMGPRPGRPPTRLIRLPVTGLCNEPKSSTRPAVGLGIESVSNPGLDV